MKKRMLVVGISGMLFSTMILGSTIQAHANDMRVPNQEEISLTKVLVNNWDEFKTAIEDPSITDVELANDLKLESKLYVHGNVKNIHGSGHTIDANKKQIEINTDSTIALMENIRIQNTDIYGLLWSLNNNVEVTYRSVEHTGDQLIYLPQGKLILDGKVSSMCSAEEVFQGKLLELLPNADVSFQNTSGLWAPVSMLYTDASLKVGKDANFVVNSNAVSITGGDNFTIENEGKMNITSAKHIAIHGAAHSNYDFKDGSSLKAVANDSVEEGVQANTGSMFIRKGATFEVESRGTQGAVIAGDQLVFEEGSNFSITNQNDKGAVFGSYPTPVNVSLNSSKGVSTWNRGNVTSEQPDASYSGFTNASFDLSGYLNNVSQTNLVSDNAEFTANYQTGATGKIIGGSFVQVAVEKPVLNVVNDKDKQLTGLGIPGATINAYVNGVLIGTTVVNGEGRWTMDITPQQEGTKIDVNQTIDGDTSENVSQIVSHLGAQTINFFKLGYWQPYGLVLEGSIDNGDLDLTNTTIVKKKISLIDSTGADSLTVEAQNTDWYNAGVFNGYQAIIENDKLNALTPGEYKISITLEVDQFRESQDLNVSTMSKSGYHNVFTDIEQNLVGEHTVSTLNKNGVGYLVVE